MSKKQQIIKRLRPIAPGWAHSIEESCRLDDNEIELMASFNTCIVGESHYAMTKKTAGPVLPVYGCKDCHTYSLRLLGEMGLEENENGGYEGQEFEVNDGWLDTLDEFVKHFNEKHPRGAPK